MTRRAIMLSRSPVQASASGPTNGASSAGSAWDALESGNGDAVPAAESGGPFTAVATESPDGEEVGRWASPGDARHAHTSPMATRVPSGRLSMAKKISHRLCPRYLDHQIGE